MNLKERKQVCMGCLEGGREKLYNYNFKTKRNNLKKSYGICNSSKIFKIMSINHDIIQIHKII